MEDLDQRLIHQYHIPLANTMETVARALSGVVRERSPDAKRILVLAGSGNNGGFGLAFARLASDAGKEVRVVMTRPEMLLKQASKRQFEKLPDSVMVGVSDEASDDELLELLNGSGVIVDALLGYRIVDELTGEAARLVRLANQVEVPVIALDVPTGLDPDQGLVNELCIEAEATVCLGLPKEGVMFSDAKEVVGDLYVVDIGIPDAWFKQENIIRPPYTRAGFVKLRDA